MKFNLNNKGFSFSPYLMIVMMFLGIIMAFHFMMVDSDKAVAIAEEGTTVKNALQVEGIKSAVRNVILLSAYDAIDAAINDRNTDAATHTVESLGGLKNYLIEKILNNLNGVTSNAGESNIKYGSLGAWKTLSIKETDDKGKIRTDGFLVSAEEWSDTAPIKVEKFVDSGIFAYYDKYKNYKKDFSSGFSNVLSCKLGVSCQPTDKILSRIGAISCSSSEPQDYYMDANEVVKRIKEALIDLAKTEVRGTGSFSGNKLNNAPITYNVDYIEANVEMKPPSEREGECCDFVYGEKKNYCKDEKHDQVYDVSITISGTIHFKELNLTMDATAKETGDGFEVCVMHTLMTKDGTVKALQSSEKDFNMDYTITISYTTPHKPGPVITKSAKLTGGEIIPNFKMNENSLKYTLEPVKCEWGPSDAYTPKCTESKGALRAEYVKYSKCHNACYYEENVPNSYSSWHYLCPPDDWGPPNE